MFIMYVSVFLQTYKNVYFTYKYLPKRFITSDNHKKKSLMGILHYFICFVNPQWIWNITIGFLQSVPVNK